MYGVLHLGEVDGRQPAVDGKKIKNKIFVEDPLVEVQTENLPDTAIGRRLSAVDLLPLDATRTVSFAARGATYTYYFPRITSKDWDHCFKAIEISFEDDGKGGRLSSTTSASAFMALAREKVQRVEGYAGELMGREDWRRWLPSGHVLLVANVLQEAAAGPAPEGAIDPLRIEISLNGLWGSPEAKMLRYSGLKHRFAPPSMEHERQLNRAMSESVTVMGSLTRKEFMPAKHPVLMRLYDELIESVEGYSAEGRPLEGRERIIEYMDGYHKYLAAKGLFEAPEAGKAAAGE